MKTSVKFTLLFVAFMLMAGAAYAKFAKPEEAIKYRKSVMLLIVQHFKPMGAVVQGKMDYDQQAFAKNAEVVKLMATLPWEAFMEPGTDKGDTTMSSAVFSKKAEFEAVARDFEMATEKLAAAAMGSDMNAIKAAFGTVAQSCKACHQPFRTK